MPPQYWRQTRDVTGVNDLAIGCQFRDCFLHVDGIPVDDGVESEAESAELLLLALTQGVAHFAAVSMIDFSGQLVSEFLSVQLNEYAPSEICIVDIVQDVHGFDQTPQMQERFGQGCGAVSHLEDAHNTLCFQMAEFQGPSKADEVLTVFQDQFCVDCPFGDCAQGP